jgi:hypothetical protein
VSAGTGPSISGTGKIAVGDSHTSNAITPSCTDELEGLYGRVRGYIDMANRRLAGVRSSRSGQGDIAATNQSLAR